MQQEPAGVVKALRNLGPYIIEGEYRDKWGRPSAAKRGYGHQWKKKRDEIIKRDKYKCQKCGKTVRGQFNRQVDHRVNRKLKSGTDAPSNLRLLCGACHRIKTAKHDRK